MKIIKNKAVRNFVHGLIFMFMITAVLTGLSLLVRGDHSFEENLTAIFVIAIGTFIIGNLLGGERNE